MTFGHLDVISRAAHLFIDSVIVAVATGEGKYPPSSVADRIEMLKESTADNPVIEVVPFKGLP